MKKFKTRFGGRIHLKQIADGQWEACLNGVRVCLAPRQKTALGVARALDRHRAERSDG